MSKPAETLIVRKASPHDRENLEALMRRASLALPAYRAQLEAHPEVFEVPAAQVVRGDVFVAEVAGAITGFAALEGSQLDGLFVEPTHWRQGIGRALVREAVHEARRRGLSLRVVAGPEARSFYESCGFTVESEASTRFGPALRMSR